MDNSPAGNAPAPDPAGDEVEGVADIIPGSEDEETAAGGPSQSEEEEMCRYCHDPAGETPDTQLVLPCRCTTPVHQLCLAKWVFRCFAQGRGNASRCEVCHTPWTGLLSVTMEDLAEQLASMPSQAAQQRDVQQQLQQLLAVMRAQFTAALAQARDGERERTRTIIGQLDYERSAAQRQVEELREQWAECSVKARRAEEAKAEAHTQRMGALKENQKLRQENAELKEDNAAQRWWLRAAIGVAVGLAVGGSVWYCWYTGGSWDSTGKQRIRSGSGRCSSGGTAKPKPRLQQAGGAALSTVCLDAASVLMQHLS